MVWLELRDVNKMYPGGLVAAQGLNLSVEQGEMFVIVGPSGSGKSTLLRMIAGLEGPDSGMIRLDGQRIDHLAPRDRDVAMVFQDQALYPHLDVFENIAFGLRARRCPRREVVDRVEGSASVLGVETLLRRRPSTLSGGQRRRVALARAMVLRPKLFLLDEPFSGLDAPLRASTRGELADLRARVNATMILVTHDQAEAMAMGDRVAVLDRGCLMQVARPIELYHQPSCRFVAEFVGQPAMSLLPCLMTNLGEQLRFEVAGLDDMEPWFAPLSASWVQSLRDHVGDRVEVGFHSEQVQIASMPSVGGDQPSPSFPATVSRVELLGPDTLVEIKVGPYPVHARVAVSSPIRVGDRIRVVFDFEQGVWFDPVTQSRIG